MARGMATFDYVLTELGRAIGDVKHFYHKTIRIHDRAKLFKQLYDGDEIPAGLEAALADAHETLSHAADFISEIVRHWRPFTQEPVRGNALVQQLNNFCATLDRFLDAGREALEWSNERRESRLRGAAASDHDADELDALELLDKLRWAFTFGGGLPREVLEAVRLEVRELLVGINAIVREEPSNVALQCESFVERENWARVEERRRAVLELYRLRELSMFTDGRPPYIPRDNHEGFPLDRQLPRLGAGTFGVVIKREYKHEDVAVRYVKVLQEATDQDAIAEEEEVILQKRIAHVNVCDLRGWMQEENGHKVLVQEYADGGSLDCLLTSESILQNGKLKTEDSRGNRLEVRFPPTTMVDIFYQAALGIEFMHHQSVIHRDISLGNILLTRNLIPKIADFNISKVLLYSVRHTLSGDRGNMHTQAPEVARYYNRTHEEVYPRYTFPADVYSLGVVMQHFCGNVYYNYPPTGNHPVMFPVFFRHGPAADGQIPDEIFDDPLQQERLQSIIRRCLAHEPRDRYGRSTENPTELLSDALLEILQAAEDYPFDAAGMEVRTERWQLGDFLVQNELTRLRNGP